MTANYSNALQGFVARMVVPVQLAEAQAKAELSVRDQTVRSAIHFQKAADEVNFESTDI